MTRAGSAARVNLQNESKIFYLRRESATVKTGQGRGVNSTNVWRVAPGGPPLAGVTRESEKNRPKTGVAKLPSFLSANSLKPYIYLDLAASPIKTFAWSVGGGLGNDQQESERWDF